MPKSKRDKKISLTRVEKKGGIETKQRIIENVRSSVDNYARVFVFHIENMRNNKLKSVREKWNHSKFFIGKNKVMAKALGRSEEDEYNENLHKVSSLLRHECGLMFTNETEEAVQKYFSDLADPDFARTGGVARETVVLPEGPLSQFCHSLEPQLRKLGLPTTLNKGVVTLIKEHVVCKEGDTLTSEQARILKLLGLMQAEFRLRIVAVWRNDGTFKILDEPALRERERPHSEYGEDGVSDDEDE